MDKSIKIEITLNEGYGFSILEGFIKELKSDEAVKSVKLIT